LRELVAEDNPVNQQLVRVLLERRQHLVTLVDNGGAAVDRCLAGDFDVALIDIQMPVLDGFAATSRIRAGQQRRAQRTPIVALTAHALKGDRERCLNAGMDGYVSKPIVAEELYRVIDSVVSRRESPPPQAVEQPREQEGRWDRALKQTGGDRQLLVELMTIFLHECPHWLSQLRRAVDAGDFGEVRRLAHSIKGSCGYFAADAAYAAAFELEEAGQNQQGAARAFQNLEVELERMLPDLREFTDRASARETVAKH